MNKLLWLGPLAGLVLAGCGAPETVMQAEMDVATESAAGAAAPTDFQAVPAPAPQLAKQANLTLRVEAIADSVEAAAAIAAAHQGDVLDLEDSSPEYATRRQATLRIQVPQAQLDATLDRLAALGQVQHRQIRAEDVSTQLVDLGARLRNLRKTEEMLLGIMERSGSVADVLQVAQEVSSVRASIEQIDAQLQGLQNRVRYATVSVTLESATVIEAPAPAISAELANTWQRASRSFRDVSVALVKLALWLLVYSPYVGLLVLLVLGARQLRRRSARPGESS